MALVQLSDLFIKKVYGDIQVKNTTEKTAFVESGAIVKNPEFDAKAREGNNIVEVPFWNDLSSASEPNYGNDDPDSRATPQKVTASSLQARVAYLNNGWSAADLAVEIGRGIGDPMTRIKSRTAAYWQRQFQKRAIAMALGILNKNVATNSGDMVHDIAIADGDAATSANFISRSAVVESVFTLGDQFDAIRSIALHSVVYKRLVDQQQIDFVQPAGIDIQIPYYLGKRVIVDDGMPAVAGGTSGVIYTTILFGAGAMAYGEGEPEVPVEVKRDADAGNGAGIETLWERKTWLLHAAGHNFTSSSITGGKSANITDLKNSANWTRTHDRKHVPLAFLKTNG